MESLKRYMQLGGKYAFASLLIAAFLFVLAVLRPWKKREIARGELWKWFLSFWYFSMLLLVVFIGRSPMIQATNYYPFEVLRQALISPDWHAWLQLLLNIIAFVPLGLFLVWHAQGRDKSKLIYLLALLLPLLIEGAQYIFQLGALDVDDLLANSLGALWGLCLGHLVTALRAHKKSATIIALLSALPLLALATGLIWFSVRPYGFLQQDFADPMQPKPNSVDISQLRGQLPDSLPVYCAAKPAKAEAEQTADRLFAALGLTRQLNLRDDYDDFSVFWAENSNVYAWIYFNGEFFLVQPNGIDTTQEEPTEAALHILEKAGFVLPPCSEHTENTLTWHFVPQDGLFYDGEITVSWKRIDYRVHILQPGFEQPTMDDESLQQAIHKGHFIVTESEGALEQIDSIVCHSFTLGYQLDSKGLYRPVYYIACLLNGEASTILTPAF